MATTISPGAGHGVLFTHQGIGTTPGYDAIDLRRALSPGDQEGVIEAGSYEVVQRAAGATMSVDINANVGLAKVQGDSVTAQGLYTVAPHSAVINEAISSNSSGFPRVDQVILEVRDNVHDAGGGNEARVRVVEGTATSGATLDNRTGAAALPSNAIRLADVLVANGAASITNSEIRDRRPWARGALKRIIRNSGDYSITATSITTIDSTNLRPRVECSGVPIRVTLGATARHNTAGATTEFDIGVDGTRQAINRTFGSTGYPANMVFPVDFVWEFVPSAGSHLIGPMAFVSTGTATLFASGNAGLVLTIEEVVRQNGANNETTSG